jgi:hypothetical protein
VKAWGNAPGKCRFPQAALKARIKACSLQKNNVNDDLAKVIVALRNNREKTRAGESRFQRW